MYSRKHGLILGFHGCDLSVRDKVVSKKGFNLTNSENEYDWLGHGIYFWENDFDRALFFATESSKRNSKIKEPAVLGAVIDLGFCLDLLESSNFELLKNGYDILKSAYDNSLLSDNPIELPKNIDIDKSGDVLLRNLDCAVIEVVHALNLKLGNEYDSVRGAFWEGEELYPNAGFKNKNHIQIAIRNPNCIKGYFIPRNANNQYSIP